MGDPRNPARIDEEWNPVRLAVLEEEIINLSELVVVSGGWAWHFLSPKHQELKILHDHKDIDLFVKPDDYNTILHILLASGYERASTIHDGKSKDFYRYKKFIEKDGEMVKVIIDLFLEDVPFVEVDGIKVVEPKKLLSYYDLKQHTTDDCTAVKAARIIITAGESLIKNKKLIGE